MGRPDRLRARLFAAGAGCSDGILRLYTESGYFRWHIERYGRIGATRRVLTPGRISADYPALTDACLNGMIVSGIEVVGFTVNIHAFMGRLVSMLESVVRFHWDAEWPASDGTHPEWPTAWSCRTARSSAAAIAF